MIKHIKRWNKWRKFNANSWFYKILVLLKLANSPTFEAYKIFDDPIEIKPLAKKRQRGLRPNIVIDEWRSYSFTSDEEEKDENSRNDNV